MQALYNLSDLHIRPSSPLGPRPPPPAHYDWQSFSVEYDHPLPVLPPIRDRRFAAQARTTKQYLAWQDGRKHVGDFTDEDEARSFRQLEWVGDALLRHLYAIVLLRLFPHAKSAALTNMRGVVASSNVHSYLGWQYRLDQRILEPPIEPGHTSVRPFREWQACSADLLEAHMGALGMEGRMDEVEAWVTALLSPATAKIEAAIRVVGKPRKLARIGANGKRGAEQDEFRGGVDMDPLTNTHRIPLFTDCRSTVDKPLAWDDRHYEQDGRWHCHLIAREGDKAYTLACGTSRSRVEAHERAVIDAVKSIRSRGLDSPESAELLRLVLLSA